MSLARVHVPDGLPEDAALSRCTHLGVGAHQDDLEFMAFHGIVECLNAPDRWFGGVICSDGGGSSRTGPYANFTDEEMKAVRRDEQNRAADEGRYGIMIQLDLPSRAIKDPADHRLQKELLRILKASKPRVVYTHNPADKHESHLAVFAALLAALRALPEADRPTAVYGCEGWRGLDWLADDQKILLDTTGHDDLARRLNSLFDSQIAGGKRYDLAVEGRRRANATFFNSHASDAADSVTYAMDLLPLVQDPTLDPTEFVCEHVEALKKSVADGLRRYLR